MIDLHSHIIFGVDDGSKDKDMTINMLKKAEESGTRKIVATPHFFKGYFEIPSTEIKLRIEDIKALARDNGINIEIYQGQEVYYSENILEYFEEGLISTINNSKYMLIELPIRSFSASEVVDTLYELQMKGIVPVIAHPERYHKFIKEPKLINKFIEEGYLFQLNTGSIAGDFGKDVKKTAEIFIKNRIYSFCGSDAHRHDKRTTDMNKGLREIWNIDKHYIDYVKESSENLLEDKEVKFIGNKIKEKKSGVMSFFRR